MNKCKENVDFGFYNVTGMGLVSFHMGKTELYIHLMVMAW